MNASLWMEHPFHIKTNMYIVVAYSCCWHGSVMLCAGGEWMRSSQDEKISSMLCQCTRRWMMKWLRPVVCSNMLEDTRMCSNSKAKPRKNTYIRLTMLLGQEKKLRDLLPLRERSDTNFTVHHFDRYNNNHQHPTSFNYSNSVTSSQFRMVFCVFACDAPIFNFPFKTKHKKILSLVVSTSST